MTTATVLELFTGYLAAATHAHSEQVDARLAVTRIVIDGTVPSDADVEPTYQSAVTAVTATVHVATSADDATLDDWRQRLRDTDATQDAVPTDTSVTLSVVRVPR